MARHVNRRGSKCAALYRAGTALLTALAVIVASSAPVRYFYCKMSGRTHDEACCAERRGAAHAVASGAEPADTSLSAPPPRCCQERRSSSMNVSSVPALGAEPVVTNALALVALLPAPWELPVPRADRAASWPIRAGPGSAREQRAHLQVYLN